MPFDGLFLHNLIDELKVIEGKRIYKIQTISETEFLFVLSNKLNLFISVNPSNPHLRLTNQKYLSSNTNLSLFLKKHIESGFITKIYQHNNDRIALIDITAFTELGYEVKYVLVLEMMGKYSNFIILDENFIIQEAAKKSFLTDERPILVKLNYEFPNSNKINPFTNLDESNINILEGICKIVQDEIRDTSLKEVLSREIKPVIYNGEKTQFYCYDLNNSIQDRLYYDSLSEMLEQYYTVILKEKNISQDQEITIKHINKEINKLKNKKEKQLIELEQAKKYPEMEMMANLLLANISKVKPYMTSITVSNFYNNNEEINIPINTKISINENINYYFNKVKKAKRTIELLSNTILDTENDIKYYEDMLVQMDNVTTSDLKEVMVEIGLRKEPMKNKKPHILKYEDKSGNIVLVGKNNVQNNYLTHTLANKEDYFFHVKNIPGSHVILKGELNDATIKLASNIAAYYSQAKYGKSVCVDYTQVKWVKKVKGTKGSFVIYTHEKNAYADPDINFIKENTKSNE